MALSKNIQVALQEEGELLTDQRVGLGTDASNLVQVIVV